MENNARKHHYVPQGYLKLFARQRKVNKDEWQITVIDKIAKKVYPTNIENVAAARDYNRVKSMADEFYWEKYYATTVEAELPKTLQAVISASLLTQDTQLVLNDEIKRKLCRIICIQMLRTPTMRLRNQKIAKSASEDFLKDFKRTYYKWLSSTQKQKFNSMHYNNDFYKSVELPFINDEKRLEQFKKFLLQRTWIIYRNPFFKVLPFITSDNPVVFYNYAKKSSNIGDNGLLVDDTIIHFPINSSLLLCLYAPTNWMLYAHEMNNCIFDLKPSYNDFKYIVNANYIQINECYRQAFTKSSKYQDFEGYILP